MSRRSRLPVLVGVLAVAALGAGVSGSGRGPAQPSTLDAMLADYLGGNRTAVARTLTVSADFRRLGLIEPRRIRRWLGAFDRGKAVVLLEVVDRATTIAPHYVRPLLTEARPFMMASLADAGTRTDGVEFFVLWHRTALGLLQRAEVPLLIDEHLAALIDQSGGPVVSDPRFLLAGAVAQEQRCRAMRPELSRPAPAVQDLVRASGHAVRDRTRPRRSAIVQEEAGRAACLEEALVRFERAASGDDTRPEARLRGGWAHFQAGHLPEALEWLGQVEAGDDSTLRYWAALFTGRVLDALGRDEAATEAYRDALAACPSGQSAAVGLALSLFRRSRAEEADALARSLRAWPPSAEDPWWIYDKADSRFVPRWLAELGGHVR